MTQRKGPLAGIRVLELGSFIAGPFSAQLLGDYGADIIKIEDPKSGDAMRGWGVTLNGESLWWPSIARNKRSITIDLRNPKSHEIVQQIATKCDIVIENFKPGRLDAWGLTYDYLALNNPSLIMVRISGFGQTGPRSNEAGFGSIGEAVGGIRYTTGYPDRPSTRTGVSLGDSLAGMFGVIGALAALTEARTSGKGQEVDVAIYESVAAIMESSMADFEIGGVLRGRSGSVLPRVAPSNSYRTSDGVEIVIAANADAVFERLCFAIGAPELSSDKRFSSHQARGEHLEELDALIESWTTTMTAEFIENLFKTHEIPIGRIFNASTMLNDSHYAAREMVIRTQSTQGWNVPMPGVVPRFSRTPGSIYRSGPPLGFDTQSILQDLLGMSDEAIQRLHDQSMIGFTKKSDGTQ